MLVSINWLKDFVEINNIELNEFTEKMTMSGTKVEGVEELGSEVTKVVVGKILSIEKHPDADKLVITKVDIGEEVIQIVTGAKNINVGDVIPTALIGAKLKDLKIKKSKLRGIESQGMMCSAGELGMNTSLLPKEQVDGIYILNNEYELGKDIKSILGLDDTVVDFELTSNRSDCLSVIGIAREVSATFNKHLILPIIEVKEIKEDINDYLKVSIEDEQLCPRYVTRMMRINKIGPSPDWMQRRLLNSGVRPINNIVDVTNYVMLEMGQPLHAFDYDKLESKEIFVRKAKKDEVFTTLDGVKRVLDENMIVISNGKDPMAIAGAMGGENSEIDNSTKMIVIESANFNKKSVRHTGRKLGLRSEAANRFEKGVDPDLADLAADRAVQLLHELGVGEVLHGRIDVYPKVVCKKTININSVWFNKFIGIDLSILQMKEYLERLFLTVEVEGDQLIIGIPTYRQDLEIKEDIAEEIVRLYGYNNIPNTIMSGVTTKGGRTKSQTLIKDMKTFLSSKGFYEILTTSFTGEGQLEDLNINKNKDFYNGVKVINPLGEENSIMRPTLIPGLLQGISHNYNRNIVEGMFYEVAVTYKNTIDIGEKLPTEEKNISMGIYGEKNFFHLKGYVELLIKKLMIEEKVEYINSNHPTFHPKRVAKIIIKGVDVGILGEIHPIVVENYELPRRTYVCELRLEELLKLSNNNIAFTELPKYPEISRDVALIVEEKVSAKEVEDIIRVNGKGLLEDLKLFDVYRGAQIDEGYKSMAYSLIFRSKEKTLTDIEINEIFDKIIAQAQVNLGAQLRE
ncbi:phenylalanine--tRNA ligase subunit beta [Alkalibaculum sp. M08DMB]|uniref:Phenylalanine--tRNA ligase beta subunit n=1 Tax=Alkalibaculum sporogenes TaxID=2655001 RepID=A0A6A7K6Y8_9FIRM|nr:phenylalanine--tRNA ligase subunit beta [Alkalibaculum sporogenes]MPW25112.1 phenylalanine--tRNA ligase subunit beta [Alkalibaculum sporogenes]